MDRWMDGRVEGWMERWIDMGMDEWMGRSLDAGSASPATVWRAPRFATEGGQLAAGVVQCAILDLKEADFGW